MWTVTKPGLEFSLGVPIQNTRGRFASLHCPRDARSSAATAINDHVLIVLEHNFVAVQVQHADWR